jgi:hypothetical protein
MRDEGLSAAFDAGVAKYQSFMIHRHLPAQFMYVDSDIELLV